MNKNDNHFVHLKSRSHYSILEGSIKIESLVNRASSYDMPALALTDNCNLFGAMEFTKSCIKKGIQPIIGCNIALSFTDDISSKSISNEITLYVADSFGWKNLSKLVSNAYLNLKMFKNRCITLNELVDNNKGLLVLYNDIASKNIMEDICSSKEYKLIKILYETFKDRLYLDLFRENQVQSIKERNLMNLSYKLKIPLICSNNIYFLDQSMYEAHDCLYCIYQSTNIANLDRNFFIVLAYSCPSHLNDNIIVYSIQIFEPF